MQLKQANIKNIRRRLVEVRELGRKYFTEIRPKQIPEDIENPEDLEGLFHVEGWVMTKSKDYKRWENLSHSIKNLSIDIAAAARLSPLLSDADMQELRHNTRQMLANLKFRKYMYYGFFVHHDEGVFLGVDPPTHEEVPLPTFSAAADYFDRAADKTLDIVDLLMANEGADLATPGTANYEPNTAFIMMAIDSNKPELEDIKFAIEDVFKDFGIDAKAVNDMQHEEAITERILSEIETREFLIADLTFERPNVYYEIGYAHALNKRVILVRKKGTKLHFDVAHRNCPEYENTTALRKLLKERLEVLTNRTI